MVTEFCHKVLSFLFIEKQTLKIQNGEILADTEQMIHVRMAFVKFTIVFLFSASFSGRDILLYHFSAYFFFSHRYYCLFFIHHYTIAITPVAKYCFPITRRRRLRISLRHWLRDGHETGFAAVYPGCQCAGTGT